MKERNCTINFGELKKNKNKKFSLFIPIIIKIYFMIEGSQKEEITINLDPAKSVSAVCQFLLPKLYFLQLQCYYPLINNFLNKIK